MFCYLALPIYLCVEVSKKGCQCQGVCPFERKGNWISVNAFLYFNSKACKRLPKELPMGKKCKKIFLSNGTFSSKSDIESFDSLIFPLKAVQISYKCVTALLTLTETRYICIIIMQNKRFHEFLTWHFVQVCQWQHQ